MPPPVSQDFLEDALATWERLRRWTDLNRYLTALRSQPFDRPPQYETEPYSMRLARRVNEVVDRLSAHSDTVLEKDVTPRGALLALAADVRLCLLPLPTVNSYDADPELSAIPYTSTSSSTTSTTISSSSFTPPSTSPPPPVTTNTTATTMIHNTNNHTNHTNHTNHNTNVDAWAGSVQYRDVSGVAVMEGLHILTCPSVQLRIDANVAQLRRRVRGAMGGGAAWVSHTHTPQELHALRATALLLDDFTTLYERALATFACVRVMGSSHVPLALLPVLHELYCELGAWVLEAETSAAIAIGARVQSFEPKKLKLMLRRPNREAAWGLRFNQQGKLIGVSAMVRSASVAGERLHKVVQATKGGVLIHRYNTKMVDFTKYNAAEAARQFELLSPKQTRVYLVLKAEGSKKQCVEQLAFFTTTSTSSATSSSSLAVTRNKEQKGKQRNGNRKEEKEVEENERGEEEEEGSYQHNKMIQEQKELPRATLVLFREDYNVSWDMAVTRDLVIVDVPAGVLSPEAQTFFNSHPRQIRISAINGVEVTCAEQVEALSSVVNTIVLDVYCGAPSVIEKENNTKETTTQPVRRSKTSVSANNANGTSRSAKRRSRQKEEKTQDKQGNNNNNNKVDDVDNDSKEVLQSTTISDDPLKLNSDTITSSLPSKRSVGKKVRSETKLKKSESSSPLKLDDIMSTTLSTSSKNGEYKLSDDVLAALKETPLLPLSTMRSSAKPFLNESNKNSHNEEEENEKVDDSNIRANDNYENNKFMQETREMNSIPSVDADGMEEPVVNRNTLSTLGTTQDQEWANLPSSSTGTSAIPTTHMNNNNNHLSNSNNNTDTVDVPLIFPNDVTLDLLTLDEMVLRRQSAEKKWGLALETAGADSGKIIRVVGLPTMNERLQRHPFYKLFHTNKDNWRIVSVNGTPASKLPEVLDIMKHTLKMQIKFQRRW